MAKCSDGGGLFHRAPGPRLGVVVQFGGYLVNLTVV